MGTWSMVEDCQEDVVRGRRERVVDRGRGRINVCVNETTMDPGRTNKEVSDIF